LCGRKGVGMGKSTRTTQHRRSVRSSQWNRNSVIDGDTTGVVEEEEEGLVTEFLNAFLQNLVSVFSLSAFVILYIWGFMGVNLFTPSLMAYLLLTVIGLAIFGIGLRQGFMPLGEKVGERLPSKVPLAAVLVVVLVLGALCTIAEPAIAALEEAGEHTNRRAAPLLAMILDEPMGLMIAVGTGVGVAAVFGCTRLIFDLPIKTCLICTLAPAIIVTFVCRDLLGGSFLSTTGLAWDCGAVTTGPVTVPIVLALGIGIAASTKAQKKRQEMERKSGGTPAEMAEYEECEAEKLRHTMRQTTMLPEIDPIDQDFEVRPSIVGTGEEAEEEVDLSGFGIVAFASLLPVGAIFLMGFLNGGASVTASDVTMLAATVANATAANVTAANATPGGDALSNPLFDEAITSFMGACRAVLPLAGFLLLVQVLLVREKLDSPLLVFRGLFLALMGMFIFTIGLFGGLVPLGQGAGKALPLAGERFGPMWGPAVILAFGFFAGMGATFSEPALAALGATVERLTKGKFTQMKLVFSVAIGVGCGIAMGFAKVYFDLNLWVILGVGYTACLILTLLTDDAIVCIAWDSAGVTTGPVTVPIVMASGLALAQAVDAVEGFGILTCASIGPILSVLLAGQLGTGSGKKVAAREVSHWRSPLL